MAAASGRKAQQSRLTNSSRLLPGVNGNSTWVRRCKDIIAAHMSDLGGDDSATQAERSIVRRASVLTVEMERIERQFALAEATDPELLDLYQRTANSLRRLLEAVGLQRRARDVTPPDPLAYACEVTIEREPP